MSHPAITAFVDSLRAANKASTATSYAGFLRMLEDWCAASGCDLLTITADDLRRFQVYLADEYQTAAGNALALTTQATAITVIRSFYRHLTRSGVLVLDPAASLVSPSPPMSPIVHKDYLDQQEATALVETMAAEVEAASKDARALALRNLALVSLALATGRRCKGLVSLDVSDLDPDRDEVRVGWEKGKSGRVLPVAAWSMAVVRRYVSEARPVILGDRPSAALFVSQRADRLCTRAVTVVLDAAVTDTIAANPDLVDLPGKCISTHSLRVSFAAMMFANGCNIRILNELMLHSSLTTTARYTPIPIEDLRRVLLTTHPRAG
jgi:site-specific recombinase XerD